MAEENAGLSNEGMKLTSVERTGLESHEPEERVKVSVFRAGSYLSLGSQTMAPWARRAYRTGYLLMGLACVGAIGFIEAWR